MAGFVSAVLYAVYSYTLGSYLEKRLTRNAKVESNERRADDGSFTLYFQKQEEIDVQASEAFIKE